MNLKLLLLFFLSICFPSFSQNTENISGSLDVTRKYSIGVTGGLGQLVVRDQVISNYLYKGSYVPLGVHLDHAGTFKKFWISFEFLNGPVLKTKTNEGFAYKGDLGDFYDDEKDGIDFSTLKSKMYVFNTTQLFQLNRSPDATFKFFLGYDFALSRFQKKFLQFEYINELTDRVISLGLVFNVERSWNEKHYLEYNLSLPQFVHVRRTLYNPDSDPAEIRKQKLAYLSGFQSKFTYRYQVALRFSLRASYTFQYQQISFPEKEQWAYNQLVLGAFFHF